MHSRRPEDVERHRISLDRRAEYRVLTSSRLLSPILQNAGPDAWRLPQAFALLLAGRALWAEKVIVTGVMRAARSALDALIIFWAYEAGSPGRCAAAA